MSDPVHQALAADREGVLARLAAFLAIPSVSTDPAFLPHVAAAQQALQQRLAAAGFRQVRLLDCAGHRPVYAEWLGAPGRPTLLVYGHYDVQPPDPLAAWTTPPFAPAIRDGRIYARGASDDKGPLSVAVEVLCAFLAVEGRLPCNVKLLIEGEEEVGSRHLPAIVAANRELLACDALLSADGARWRADLPALNIGSRGIAVMELALETAGKDLHSGRYGGAVRNALHEMARLVAGLHDAEGRVAVPGFHDGVLPPANAEAASLVDLPFDEAAFHAAIAAPPHGEPGHSTLERLWFRPCLDVNGLWGGYTGAGSKTVIPSRAQAKLSCRLVPGQQPAAVLAALRRHLQAACPPGVRLSFTGEPHAAPAYLLPGDHPLLAACEGVLRDIHGRPPVRVRIGATLPISELFRRELGVDTVMFSFSTADEDFHAPNEHMRLAGIDEGLQAWVMALRAVGRQAATDYAAFRAG